MFENASKIEISVDTVLIKGSDERKTVKNILRDIQKNLTPYDVAMKMADSLNLTVWSVILCGVEAFACDVYDGSCCFAVKLVVEDPTGIRVIHTFTNECFEISRRSESNTWERKFIRSAE